MSRVTLFTLSGDKASRAARKVLKEHGIKYNDMSIDEPRNLTQMNFMTGRDDGEVPQVFFGATHVGGLAQLQELAASGNLKAEFERVLAGPTGMRGPELAPVVHEEPETTNPPDYIESVAAAAASAAVSTLPPSSLPPIGSEEEYTSASSPEKSRRRAKDKKHQKKHKREKSKKSKRDKSPRDKSPHRTDKGPSLESAEDKFAALERKLDGEFPEGEENVDPVDLARLKAQRAQDIKRQLELEAEVEKEAIRTNIDLGEVLTERHYGVNAPNSDTRKVRIAEESGEINETGHVEGGTAAVGISDHKEHITVFGRKSCKDTIRTRELLNDNSLGFNFVNIGSHPALAQQMRDLSKLATTPQIFFHRRHVGNYDDVLEIDRRVGLKEYLKPLMALEPPNNFPPPIQSSKEVRTETSNEDEAGHDTEGAPAPMDAAVALRPDGQKVDLTEKQKASTKVALEPALRYILEDEIVMVDMKLSNQRIKLMSGEGHQPVHVGIIMDDYHTMLKVRDRVQFDGLELPGLFTIPIPWKRKTFSGSALVDAIIIEVDEVVTRSSALSFARHLVQIGLARRTSLPDYIMDLGKAFEDSESVTYRFQMDQTNRYLNNNCVWIDPVRPPLIVMAGLRYLLSDLVSENTTEGGHVNLKQIFNHENYTKFILAISELQRVNLHALVGDQRIAFWLNIYHCLLLHSLIECKKLPNSKSTWRKFVNQHAYLIGRWRYSLSDIVNGILRNNRIPPWALAPPFPPSDPRQAHCIYPVDTRIHFAISNLTAEGPPFQFIDEASVGAELDVMCMSYLAQHIRIDIVGENATLPGNLSYYWRDFGTSPVDVLPKLRKFLDPQRRRLLYQLYSGGNVKVKFGSQSSKVLQTGGPVRDLKPTKKELQRAKEERIFNINIY